MRRSVIVGAIGIFGGAVAADRLTRRRERRERAREAAARVQRHGARGKRSIVQNAQAAALRKQATARIAKTARTTHARKRAHRLAETVRR
jgi:hypothetical protein